MIKSAIKKVIKLFVQTTSTISWKEFNELRYWKSVKSKEGDLSNNHYEYFYTTHFGFDSNYYDNKVIMDLGCGPRGSLEWASNAKRRIGVDPLANEYLKLGANKHNMEYINAASESIPLENNACDAIFSFNSLDHVENVEKTIKEIKRILKPNGCFLLLVEINHPPTECEPHELNAQFLLHLLSPELKCQQIEVYKPLHKGMYQSIKMGQKIDDALNCKEVGFLSALFIKE